jgi:hypothetical protein
MLVYSSAFSFSFFFFLSFFVNVEGLLFFVSIRACLTFFVINYNIFFCFLGVMSMCMCECVREECLFVLAIFFFNVVLRYACVRVFVFVLFFFFFRSLHTFHDYNQQDRVFFHIFICLFVRCER